jgi:hypothetical protein
MDKKPKKPRIEKKASVLKTEISLDFTDTDGIDSTAIIKRDVEDPDNWEVSVNGQKIAKETGRALEEFLFCERDEKGDIEFNGKNYSCHVVKEASEGAFLLGNHSCPLFLNPPGIVINL